MPNDKQVIDRQGRLIVDAWSTLAEGAAWPASGRVIAPVARLPEAPAGVEPGALLTPDETLDDLLPWLPRLGLIAVSFPKFRDGRGFSQARALREHHGYTGDIRAVGHPLPDQYLALIRCGVSTVELPEQDDPRIWAEVLALRGGLDALPLAERPVPLLRRLAARIDV